MGLFLLYPRLDCVFLCVFILSDAGSSADWECSPTVVHFTLRAARAAQQGKGTVEMTPVHFICLNKPILMNLLHCLPIQIQDENGEPDAN